MGEVVIEIRKCEIEDTYLQFARGIWRARCDHATVDVVEIQKWVVGTWSDGQTRLRHQSTAVRPARLTKTSVCHISVCCLSVSRYYFLLLRPRTDLSRVSRSLVLLLPDF
jgi:hypothetical protein